YAFVPLGFLLAGLSIFAPDLLLPSAALHAWTAGAIGVMTLAVMTRASLGHLGRPLKATPAIAFIYICILAGALLRIAAGFVAQPDPLHHLGAGFWFLAFSAFALVF